MHFVVTESQAYTHTFSTHARTGHTHTHTHTHTHKHTHTHTHTQAHTDAGSITNCSVEGDTSGAHQCNQNTHTHTTHTHTHSRTYKHHTHTHSCTHMAHTAAFRMNSSGPRPRYAVQDVFTHTHNTHTRLYAQTPHTRSCTHMTHTHTPCPSLLHCSCPPAGLAPAEETPSSTHLSHFSPSHSSRACLSANVRSHPRCEEQNWSLCHSFIQFARAIRFQPNEQTEHLRIDISRERCTKRQLLRAAAVPPMRAKIKQTRLFQTDFY